MGGALQQWVSRVNDCILLTKTLFSKVKTFLFLSDMLARIINYSLYRTILV